MLAWRQAGGYRPASASHLSRQRRAISMVCCKQADAAMYVRPSRPAARPIASSSAEMNRSARNDFRLPVRRCARPSSRMRCGFHYQPQVRADGRLYGVEALARWYRSGARRSAAVEVHSARGRIRADRADRHIVAAQACQQVAAWQKWRRRTLSVNLSPINFQNGDLATLVGEVIAKTVCRRTC